MFMTGEGKGKAGTFISLGIVLGGVATTVFSLWLHEKEIAVFHEDARRGLRAAMPAMPSPSSCRLPATRSEWV